MLTQGLRFGSARYTFLIKYFVFIFKSSLVGSWFKCFSNHPVEKRQNLYNWSSIIHFEHIREIFSTLAIWHVIWLVSNHYHRMLALMFLGILTSFFLSPNRFFLFLLQVKLLLFLFWLFFALSALRFHLQNMKRNFGKRSWFYKNNGG